MWEYIKYHCLECKMPIMVDEGFHHKDGMPPFEKVLCNDCWKESSNKKSIDEKNLEYLKLFFEELRTSYYGGDRIEPQLEDVKVIEWVIKKLS